MCPVCTFWFWLEMLIRYGTIYQVLVWIVGWRIIFTYLKGAA